jgi:formylglycine-generating enzyme required for sulfatase activity
MKTLNGNRPERAAMKKLSLFITGLVAISFIIVTPCFGYISGIVTDSVGNFVSGATVTFTNEADSTLSYSAITEIEGFYKIDASTVEESRETSGFPNPFVLMQNYPNPFNPSTLIPFTLTSAERVILTVYNIQGQKVIILIDGTISAGEHSVSWNGHDDSGMPVGAGVYLYQLRAGGRSETKKMLLLEGGIGKTSEAASPIGDRNDVHKSVRESTVSTYSVTITRNDIITYRERSILLYNDGKYNFTVTRKTPDLTFVPIPGGTFQMGDEEIERPVHRVTVSGFEMSAYEITNAQYCAYLNAAKETGDITATSSSVTGAKGAYNGKEYLNLEGDTYNPQYPSYITFESISFSVVSGKENYPVEFVTWYGSKAFALYYGLDLPTEAEWEYASRWGNHQYKYGTDDGTIGTSKANYFSSEIYQPVKVGRYSPNPFGLYDMCGNVIEWCHDWYGNYSSSDQTNPSGAQTSTSRVVRGGSCYNSDETCRSSCRSTATLGNNGMIIGFRVVRLLSPKNY